METIQLTPFGKRTRERLAKLNRDEAWLLNQLKARDVFIGQERYLAIITGEVHSRPHELAIGKLLTDEENIQKLIKRAGIKRKG